MHTTLTKSRSYKYYCTQKELKMNEMERDVCGFVQVVAWEFYVEFPHSYLGIYHSYVDLNFREAIIS